MLRGAGGKVVRVLGAVSMPAGAGGDGGAGYDDSDARRIAFVNQLGKGKAWTLAVWDKRTGALTMVASSPRDAEGRVLYGDYVTPVLTSDFLYWIQASVEVDHVTGTGVGSELMQYSFATGRTRVLYDGLAEAFVPYGKRILFTAPPNGARGNDGRPARLVVHALDQSTGQPARIPAGLSAGRDAAFRMVTNGYAIAWISAPGNEVRVWTPAWGRTITVARGAMDDLGMYRQFLVYRDQAGKITVMDLAADSTAKLVKHNGFPDLGGHYLGLWQATTDDPTNGAYVSYLIDLAKLPDLPSCPGK